MHFEQPHQHYLIFIILIITVIIILNDEIKIITTISRMVYGDKYHNDLMTSQKISLGIRHKMGLRNVKKRNRLDLIKNHQAAGRISYEKVVIIWQPTFLTARHLLKKNSGKLLVTRERLLWGWVMPSLMGHGR